MAKRITKAVHTNDGFSNLVARLGAGNPDVNLLGQADYRPNHITSKVETLDQMYRGSWLVGAVVDSIAEDMTRSGVAISGASDTTELQNALSSLGVWAGLTDAIKWGRLYGGAIGVIMIDGQDVSTPLRPETISKGQFTGLSVFDRHQVQPDIGRIITTGIRAGEPESYRILTPGGLFGQSVHYSRVVRQIGIRLPYRQALIEQMWGESVIERMYDRIVSYDSSTLGVSNLVMKAYLRTVKIEGLREVLAAGGQAEANLVKMFQYMQLLQNNEGVTLLDKEDEFQSSTYAFGGLDGVMLQFAQQLSGASGIPLVRLFGQSPAGLSATGESDMRMYYDTILQQQESRLRDSLGRILTIMHWSLFGKAPGDDFQFDFVPMWQTTADQKATIAKTTADTLAVLVENDLMTLETARRELRESAAVTGIGNTITDAEIAEVSNEPPMPKGEA
jgi:phage-related protein (TIGR01555 family)